MHGQGNFSDPRLGINIVQAPDLVTSKLPALRAYQHSLPAPTPRDSVINRDLARQGKAVFDRGCARCHVGGNGTDNNTGVLHQPAETGMDPAYAQRTTGKAYRTTPLRGLLRHPPYFHDGSAASLDAVVDHYNRVLKLNLSPADQRALVEYLKTL
jgi:mono/diheme cytochrome c family protein